GQYDPSRVSRKAQALYTKGLDEARDEHFKEGIDLLKQAVSIDSNYADAYLSIAGMYSELKDYQDAIDYYEKTRKIDSEYFRDYNNTYSINLAGKGEFEKALDAIDDFLTIPNLNETSRKAGEYRRQCYQFAIDYAKKNSFRDYKFQPVNLGDSVNSVDAE